MDWADFLHANCDAIILIRPTSHFLSLTFNVSVSILPSWHMPGCFLGIWSWYFSEFFHCARKPYEVAHDSPIFWENVFCFKNWGNGSKIAFLLKEKIRQNFHWISSLMKMFIICSVPAQTVYLGKILLLRFRPKCSQPIR